MIMPKKRFSSLHLENVYVNKINFNTIVSFDYEFYTDFFLLIPFQVSDMRYKAVRTENTHLKGMMGDLDPGQYMVINNAETIQ